MEAEDPGQPGGHGHRKEMALLPLKKRAFNDITIDRGSSIPDPDDSDNSSSPKKGLLDLNDGCVGADESKDAAGGGHEAPPPVRHHRRPPAPAAAASLEPAAAADDALFKWLNKGKWEATPAQESPAAPAAKKLMHDGIRSLARLNERRAAEAFALAAGPPPAREENKQGRQRDAAAAAAPPPQPNAAAPPPQPNASPVGAAVQRHLEQLEATQPWFVYQKPLQKSDVCPNQNRLLVSCKRETLQGCPITAIFSGDEWSRVENKDAGLQLTALDRRGEAHLLTLKFLDSNGGYRFIAGWKKLLARNGLVLDGRGGWTRDVGVEIWAFRSRKLPRQPRLDGNRKPVKAEKGKEDDESLQVPEHFHPDGSLGLIVLHHEHGRKRAQPDGDDDYDQGKGAGSPTKVAREKGKKQRSKRDAPASPAAAREGGAGAGGPSEACEMMLGDGMVSKFGESMADMATALIVIKGTDSKEIWRAIAEEKPRDDGGAIAEEKPRDNDGGGAIPEEKKRDDVDTQHGA